MLRAPLFAYLSALASAFGTEPPLPTFSASAKPRPAVANPWKPQQGNTYHLRPNAMVKVGSATRPPAIRHSTVRKELDLPSEAAEAVKPKYSRLKRLVLLGPAADSENVPDEDTILQPIVDLGVDMSEPEIEVLSTHLGATITSTYLNDLPAELFRTLKNMGRPLRGLVLIRCDRQKGEVVLRLIP